MPLLNYTTTVSVTKTVAEIHGLLVEASARSILTEYDSTGRPWALSFQVETAYGVRSFRLPANAGPVKAALVRSKVPQRYHTDQQAERVAWRILKDWLEAQLALIRTDMAALDQVMLPYMEDERTGTTVYEMYRGQQLALGRGDS